MYYYLHGIVTLHNKSSAVIECQGVGYDFLCSNIDDFPIGEVMFVYIYHYQKEDGNYFIGFKTLDEKNVFSSLVSVKGIGTKLALSILANSNIETLKEAIKQSDTKYFEKIPGIGKKSAIQIILDLKGKINDYVLDVYSNNKNKETARQALKKLGFTDTKITVAFAQITDENCSEQEYIKKALKILSSYGK